MLKPSFTKQFDRDLKRMLKRGQKQDKIKFVVSKLINEERLEPKYKIINLSAIMKEDENVILNQIGC